MNTDSPSLPSGAQITSAAQWRAKKQQSEAEAPTVMLPLPSGAIVEARRLPLDAWLLSGRLPDAFVADVIKTLKEKPTTGAELPFVKAEDLKPEEVEMFLSTARDIVTATVVRPRIVEIATADDEISAADVPDDDFLFLFDWAMKGSPDVPVAMAAGMTSAGALSNFHSPQ